MAHNTNIYVDTLLQSTIVETGEDGCCAFSQLCIAAENL